MSIRRVFRALVASMTMVAAFGLTAVRADAITIFQDYNYGQAPALPFDAPVTITNTLQVPIYGSVSVTPTSLSVTPEDPDDVVGIDASACLNQTIAYGESCQVHLHVIPSGIGTHYVHVLVSGDIDGIPVSSLFDFDIRVQIDLVAPDIDLGTADLGDVEIGVPQAIDPVLTNTYADSVTLANLDATVGGPDAADVTSTDLSDCETTLTIGASCTPHASLTPSHLGAEEVDFTVTADINGVASTVHFTSTANVVPRQMHVSPDSIDFGSYQAGRTTASTTVTLTNSSGVAATAVSVGLAGANSDQFVLSNDSCVGASLAAGAACSVDVAFSPTAHGAAAAIVRFTTDVARNLTVDVPLTAFGTAPSVTLSSASFSFVNTPNGETSRARVVTVRNTGDGVLHVSSLEVTGEDPTEFIITDDTCTGVAVAAGAKCAVAVAFAPTTIGQAGASLTIHDDTLEAPRTVSLAGTGIPSADRSVALKASPSTVVADGALTYTLRVRNLGPNSAAGVRVTQILPLGSGFVSVSGAACSSPDPGDDGVVSCLLGKVPSGASVTITVLVDAPNQVSGSTFHSVATVRASTFDPVSENNKVRRRTTIA
jgi:uncharacterized repeat protein (TIGR01451 family)